MCVIYACWAKRPGDDELKEAERMNSDGAGVAWIQKGLVRYRKGLEVGAVIKLLKKIEMPYIMHFRSASSGGRDPLLCHPFPLAGDVPLTLAGEAQKVLFHNGTWSGWKHDIKEMVTRSRLRLPEGPWSDSRALAWTTHHFGLGTVEIYADNPRLAILEAKNGGAIAVYGDGWHSTDHKKGYFQSSFVGTSRSPLPAHYRGETKNFSNGLAGLTDPKDRRWEGGTPKVIIPGPGEVRDDQIQEILSRVSTELEQAIDARSLPQC